MANDVDVQTKLCIEGTGQVKLVLVKANRNEKIGTLKQRVLQKESIQPGDNAKVSLVLNGVELDDRSKLTECGLGESTAQDWRASNYVYPNGWYSWASRRPIPRVGDYFAALQRNSFAWLSALPLVAPVCGSQKGVSALLLMVFLASLFLDVPESA
eukprot:TRINITY_DN8646_c0_g1_i1.p1 TRINITY_DN8646_c0_g1~~TRINITY_DN8646_c0_g1_i1.p1  ORF type:complete len:171 (+),score=12.86 TRINITY_DN8646_c0_g1_i1:47-514(+)